MRRFCYAFLLVSFGAAASSVCAQEGFENADQNHNNKINRQEFLERETDVFFLIDSNKDGHLSIMEIKNVDVARFHAADVNGDGVLSMEEFLEARNLDFDAADTNKDGGTHPARGRGLPLARRELPLVGLAAVNPVALNHQTAKLASRRSAASVAVGPQSPDR